MFPGHCMLLLVLLLVTLAPATAHCPEKYSYKTCYQLYEAFERSLLASSENRYKLREEYLPSSKSSPVYGHIGYVIHYNIGQYNRTPACGENNDELPQVPIEHSRCISWSSSAILTYIDPMFLNSFQLHLLYLLLQNTGAVAVSLSNCGNQYHSPSMHVHLQLTLELQEELPCVPSENQMLAVLADLTSWLKAYAVTPPNMTVAEYSLYKGYSNINGTNTLRKIILCAIYILGALLVAVAMGFWAPDCYMWLVEKTDSEQNRWWWHSFFWAAFIVVGVCNASILAFEIKIFVDGISSKNLDPFTLVKLVLVFIVCLLAMIIAQCIIATAQAAPDAVSFKLRTGTCPFAIRFFVLWTFTYSVHLLSLAVLPTVIWTFVLPLRVIFLLTSTFATLFCITAFVAVIISIPSQLENKRVCKMLLLLAILALISVMSILGTILYFPLIMTSIDTASVAGVITTFLPTGGITVMGWEGWKERDGMGQRIPMALCHIHNGEGFSLYLGEGPVTTLPCICDYPEKYFQCGDTLYNLSALTYMQHCILAVYT